MSSRCRGAAAALATIAVAATAFAAGTHTIVLEAVAYKPDTLTVAMGDAVVWANKDAFPHTATAADRSFDSGEIAPGRSWTFVAKRKGTFDYVCTYHPTMKGRLVVK